MAELNKRIEKNPKDDEALYQRAIYFYYQGKMVEAQEDILQAIKLNPLSSTYQVLLSDVYFSQKETDRTEEALQKAIVLDPDNNEARLKLAELYFHLRMYEECDVIIKEAVEKQPHNPKAHLIRAFSLKERGDTTGYLRMLQLTVDQDPKEVKAFLELGYFYQQKLDPIAINYYNNALMVDPNNVEINYNLAVLYTDLGSYEKAIDHYNIILQINPNHKFALNNLGYVMLEYEEKYDDAVAYFTKVLELDSLFSPAICNRGLAFMQLQQYDNARQDFLYCRSIDPQNEIAVEGLNDLDQMTQ
ncbi:tetratricopeptide repeat protein [Bacteroidales bacterium OttesenSCG-928-B11]|nr:tetratricopeptide repeat protein [Bacteroidales bacterium OttesenSCG-928-C03]MDL2311446.1 tetratricopeptide repeat protein [Bacteroidales bacterium OttesenSCG-928-B11]